MRAKTVKSKLIAVVCAAVACLPCALAVACGSGGGNNNNADYPFNDSDVIVKDYDYVVEIIGTKTQTVYLHSGETLADDMPTNIPKKSGEVFDGWYADGATTEYDWTAPVTSDLVIRARFKKVDGLSVAHGTAFPQTDGGLLTGANDTLALLGTFERGAFAVDVTPVNEGNDCGVLFGAKVPEAETWWEDGAEYFTVLINKDGVLLFAKVNPWVVIDETPIVGYDCTKTYNIKVAFNGGFAVVYINGTELLSAEIGGLKGTGVGVRAQVAGTRFGAISFDPELLPDPPVHEVGEYTVRNGGLSVVTGGVETAKDNTLAVFTDKQQPGKISVTMKGHTTGDDGIVFALTDNTDVTYWEAAGTSYYFLFVDGGGNIRLARVVGSWSEPFNNQGALTNMKADDGTYKFDVLINGGTFTVFVNGNKAFEITDPNPLAGTAYGIRAKKAGITYESADVANKHAVIVEGAGTTLVYADDDGHVDKPTDPSIVGKIFEGWYKDGDKANGEFDWTEPVTEDVTVKAVFSVDSDVAYIVNQGGVEETGDKYKTTEARTLITLNGVAFSKGSIEATVTPVTANDCGLVFGANVTSSAQWENFDYYTLLLNSGGILYLSRLSPWAVVESFTVSGYDPTATYTLKAVYNNGYVRAYVNGTQAFTVYIGELPGSGVGFRAATAGTEFNKTVTIDPTASIGLAAATSDLGELTVRHGGAVSENNGTYTSTTGDTIVTCGKTLENGGSVSVKINVNGNTGCNGLIFALGSDVTGEFWEEYIYYFFFIDEGGSVRLARTSAWGEPFTRINSAVVDKNAEHTMTVSWDGNGVACSIDGMLYFVGDNPKISGGTFGMRLQNAGVSFKDFSVVSYKRTSE